MNPQYSAQDILLCDLCQTAALHSHCKVCQINLCNVCVGEHLSDSSKRHNVIPYKHRTSTLKYPKCPKHSEKSCELYCEKCDIPVCSTCISSSVEHKGHILSDSLQKICLKRKILEEDLNELEKTIYPVYKEFEKDLKSKKESFEEHYEKLATAVSKQEEIVQHKIHSIAKEHISNIHEMKNKHRAALNNQEKEIKHITSDVKHNMLELKKILDSDDVSLISEYNSRNSEFRCLPPKVNVLPPRFSTHWISREELHVMFGFLSTLCITKEEHGYTMKTPEAVCCPPVKPLLDEPKRIATIQTRFERLNSITCLSDEEIWTCGENQIIKLYNIQGKLLKSIKTRSDARNITVNRSRNLIYTDFRSVYEVINEQIRKVVKKQRAQGWGFLYDWYPVSVCSTSSDDLLIIMRNHSSDRQSKVVRYSNFTEKQTIQYDSEGQPLYSSDSTNVVENRNFDICVADKGANAVVVVNQTGKLRFRYTGTPSATNGSFYTYGITTDSQSHILTADYNNHCIHILNEDGQFLCCIYNRDLYRPWTLCIDTRDNLYVNERYSGIIRKIKYM
ncbi:uncharacterized protein LOC134283311 [Saccostrea cucullata]|uniref:uncharacterized protein LOC134283311 n=1 Tax=Saccostrea cuccullata TaxID=36930 RepID=UPI002ED3704B